MNVTDLLNAVELRECYKTRHVFFHEKFWSDSTTNELSNLFSFNQDRVTCLGPWIVHRLGTDGVYEFHEPIPSIKSPLEVHEGGTITREDLDKISPFVSQICKELANLLGVPECRVGAALMISRNGGTPLHFDGKEVFVIQVEGSKMWLIGENKYVESPLFNYTPHARNHELLSSIERESEKGVDDVGLEPIELKVGSVLFLPRGYWHKTVAKEFSVSVSIGVETPTALDMIIARLRHLQDSELALRTPLYNLQNSGPEVDEIANEICALLRQRSFNRSR
jgi:ribosomal protein L16 Arg81 hydroxylase